MEPFKNSGTHDPAQSFNDRISNTVVTLLVGPDKDGIRPAQKVNLY